MPGRRSGSLLLTALLAVVPLAVGTSAGTGAPPADRFAKAIAAQERATERLLARSGVVGTAVGLRADGAPAVLILTRAAGVQGLPASLDGVPVVVRVTGPITALHHKPGHDKGGGTPPPPEPPPPDPPPPTGTVSIGTSTGNVNECSSGTIGVRVKKSGKVYALSNNHVYARENAATASEQDGDQVVSPGLYDTSCSLNASNVIGRLASFVPLKFGGVAANTVDAAIAITTTSAVGTSTPPDGYGTPTTTTVGAQPGMPAQKYGRTTGLTRGTITAINVALNVGYTSGTAHFTGQILFEGTKPVMKSGDSGSVLVTDPGRQPVGLLFAGSQSGKLGVASPINAVLAAFQVTIDGS